MSKKKQYAYLEEDLDDNYIDENENENENGNGNGNDSLQLNSLNNNNNNSGYSNQSSRSGSRNNSIGKSKQVQFQLQEFNSAAERKNKNKNKNNNNNKNKSRDHLLSSDPLYIDEYDRFNDSFDYHEDNYDEDDEYNIASNMLLDDEQFYKSNYSAQRCIYRLLAYLRPQIWYYLFGLLALSITTLCQLSLPFYFASQIETTMQQSFINNITIDSSANQTLGNIGLYANEDFEWFASSKWLLLIVAIQIPFAFIRYLLFTIASFNFATQIKNDLFRSILTQEVTYFDASKGSELNAIISSDTLILQNIVSVTLSTFIRSLLQSGGGVLILAFLSWKTTLFIFSFGVLFFIVYVIFISAIHPKYKYMQELSTRASSVVDSTATNIAEIRLLNAEAKQMSAFETELETVHRAIKSSVITSGFWIAIGGFSVLLLLIFAFMFILQETIIIGMPLLQYILYALMLSVSVSGMFGVVGEFQKLLPSCRRVFSLIDRRPKVSFKGGVSPANGELNIAFDNVSFHHKSGTILLSGITFDIRKGTMVALVGPSPSKDIIFSLIQGVYYPTRGSVTIGRVDTKAVDLHQFRNKCFSITANTAIFEGTVEQNIRYGLSHLSQQNIIVASKQANLHDFIISLPQGYDTMLGKERLSTNIIQKISMARAFLRNPEILLVDETSCIAESADDLNGPLDLLYKNRTVLVIANRLSTLEKSHHVVVFEDSRVVETGTHTELLKSDLLYQNLVAKQFPASSTTTSASTSPTH